jgi:hypothetical protein
MYRNLGTVPVEMLPKFLTEEHFSICGLCADFSKTLCPPCPYNNLKEIITRV